MISGLFKSIGETAKEFSELERLFSEENKQLRQLVFYGESPIQFRYYEDYIEHILKNSDYEICYLASDPNDPLFQLKEPRIKPFFIKNTLKTAFERLDSKVLVLANPDLNLGAVQRAPDPVHHVLALRGIASTHMGYRSGAFDHYDSVLCLAPYQIAELRKAEELYKLKAKALPLIGYPLTERIYREHLVYKSTAKASKLCLVAPTWDPSNRVSIFNNCAEELIELLSATDFEVWLRPHPEFVKRSSKRLEQITKLAARTKNVSVQTQLASMECLHRADILITDHSTISMDYALATERPVIFINTPPRVDNPDFERFALPPVELAFRAELGAAIELAELKTLPLVIDQVHSNREAFRQTIPELRDKLISNWLKAGQIGGEYLLGLMKQ